MGRRSTSRAAAAGGRSAPSGRSSSRSWACRVAADPSSVRPHDVVAAREVLRERIDGLPRLRAIVGDRAFTGLARLAARKGPSLDIKRKLAGGRAFVPERAYHQERPSPD
jgi:hypothetical protein